MLDRLEVIIGKDNIDKLKSSTVLILGLGGVGSSSVEMLARNGVGKLIIVDSDKVDITNLNRQIIALNSNIGKYKTIVLEDRIKDINPNCEVIKINSFITKENINILFEEKIDFIIDACDTISTKIELIKQAKEKNINMISSMGMANKMDMAKINTIKLSKTTYDPIARLLRSKLEGIDVMTVCSTEKSIKNKTLGSYSAVTCTAGILCADYCIKSIIGEI